MESCLRPTGSLGQPLYPRVWWQRNPQRLGIYFSWKNTSGSLSHPRFLSLTGC